MFYFGWSQWYFRERSFSKAEKVDKNYFAKGFKCKAEEFAQINYIYYRWQIVDFLFLNDRNSLNCHTKFPVKRLIHSIFFEAENMSIIFLLKFHLKDSTDIFLVQVCYR